MIWFQVLYHNCRLHVFSLFPVQIFSYVFKCIVLGFIFAYSYRYQLMLNIVNHNCSVKYDIAMNSLGLRESLKETFPLIYGSQTWVMATFREMQSRQFTAKNGVHALWEYLISGERHYARFWIIHNVCIVGHATAITDSYGYRSYFLYTWYQRQEW